jgi:lipopolysaccharide export system protein LptA
MNNVQFNRVGYMRINHLLACSIMAMWAMLSAVYAKSNDAGAIDITADMLTVEQASLQAIFEGNVIAKQKDMTINSDRMVVVYRNEQQESSSKKRVDHVIATGHVVMVRGDQRAKAKRAIYKVDKKTIDLYEDVSLHQGQNIVTGNHLIYDVSTGRSQLVAKEIIVKNQPGSSGNKRPDQAIRVRAVFVPESEGQDLSKSSKK